jgi:DNA-binding transcriptional ArsR family regulator
MQKGKNDIKKIDLNFLENIFKALGSNTRLSIIDFLIEHPNSNCMRIVEALPLAQSTISKHLSELKTAKIITSSASNSVLLYQINRDFIPIIQGFLSNLNYKILQNQNTIQAQAKTIKTVRKKSSHLKKYNYIFDKKKN